MKSVFLLLFSCFLLHVGTSQDPYKLDLKKDGLIMGTTVALFVSDWAINRNFQPLSHEDIAGLSTTDINRFDRTAVFNSSETAVFRSDVGLWVPVVAASGSTAFLSMDTHQKKLNQFGKLGLIWMETNLINFAGTNLVKSLSKRIRPYVYNPDVSTPEKLETDARKSFFSRHTSISAANAFFFAKVHADYFPESKWNHLIWGLAVVVPAWTGMERVIAGKHFQTDVISGYLFGALCGYLIPQLHLKNSMGSRDISVYPVIGGDYTGLGLVWAL